MLKAYLPMAFKLFPHDLSGITCILALSQLYLRIFRKIKSAELVRPEGFMIL